jgi:hypothetical protein
MVRWTSDFCHRKQESSAMRGAILRCTVGGITAVCLVAQPRLWAIETTYGEDPVPNTACLRGSINLGYGIDPIPAKTLSERWHAWRASRGLPPVGIFPCNLAPTTRTNTADLPRSGRPTDARPTSPWTTGPDRTGRLP